MLTYGPTMSSEHFQYFFYIIIIISVNIFFKKQSNVPIRSNYLTIRQKKKRCNHSIATNMTVYSLHNSYSTVQKISFSFMLYNTTCDKLEFQSHKSSKAAFFT